MFIFVGVLIMNKYETFFSFYGIKIWLRAGKDIFPIFQSVVCWAFTCGFLFPYVILAYMKCPFGDIFFPQAFKNLGGFVCLFLFFFFCWWVKEFFSPSNQVETSWFFLGVCKIWLHLPPPIIHSYVCLLLLFQFWD